MSISIPTANATLEVAFFRATMLRLIILFALAPLVLISGCARLPDTRVTPIKPATVTEAQGYLLGQKADLDQFRLRGPFAVETREDHELALSSNERINSDLYLSASAEKAPLVIFLHGHDSSKEAHAYQAMHVASWGMHSLVLQLPNNGPWVRNGRTLARIIEFIDRQPEVIDRRIDVNKIVLVGHSFGGSAVAIALAEGARAVGGVLLDPAGIGRVLPKFLGKIKKPVMLLGADEEVFSALNRDYFYRFIPSGIFEVSIKDAAHEDAQYPSELSVQMFGIDPFTTEELQVTFVSALTSAAFSLASTGKLDYAWSSFGEVIEKGKFVKAKKK